MDDIYLVEIRLGRTRWRVGGSFTRLRGCSGSFHSWNGTHMSRCSVPWNWRWAQTRASSSTPSVQLHPGMIQYHSSSETMQNARVCTAASSHSRCPSGTLTDLVAELAAALLPLTITHNAWDAETRPEMVSRHHCQPARSCSCRFRVFSADRRSCCGKPHDPWRESIFRLLARIGRSCSADHGIRSDPSS